MGAGDIQKFEATYVKEVQVAEVIEKTHSLAVRLFMLSWLCINVETSIYMELCSIYFKNR